MNKNPLVLITGAGSGIGREFTRLFLGDGSRVLAVSLLQSELDSLVEEMDSVGEKLKTLQMDLSATDASDKLFEYCSMHDLMPDILVNNAGFTTFGQAVDQDPGKVSSMIALNITTLTRNCMLFGKVMTERRSGRILNVGSTAGMMPAARLAAYCGSKSYVNTFSFALAAEMKPYGVTVTCLTPGATATNFAKAGDIEAFDGVSKLKRMFAEGKAGSPAAVAAAGYRGLMANKRHVLTGKGSRMANVISRLLAPSTIPGVMKNV